MTLNILTYTDIIGRIFLVSWIIIYPIYSKFSVSSRFQKWAYIKNNELLIAIIDLTFSKQKLNEYFRDYYVEIN